MLSISDSNQQSARQAKLYETDPQQNSIPSEFVTKHFSRRDSSFTSSCLDGVA